MQLIVIRIAWRLFVPTRIVRDYMCLFALFAITSLFALHGDYRSAYLRLHVTISIAEMPLLKGTFGAFGRHILRSTRGRLFTRMITIALVWAFVLLEFRI